MKFFKSKESDFANRLSLGAQSNMRRVVLLLGIIGFLCWTGLDYADSKNFYQQTPPFHSSVIMDSCVIDSSWISTDIGNVPIAGSASFNGGKMNITATGTTFEANTSDNFHFIYQKVAGDIVFSAKLDTLFPSSNEFEGRAGIMLRASSLSSAEYVLISIRDSSTPISPIFEGRKVNRDPDYFSEGGLPPRPSPVWLQVRRKGTQYTGLFSDDGMTWSAIDSVDLCWPDTVLAGFAATSAASDTMRAEFSNISLCAVSTSPIYKRMYVDSAAIGSKTGQDWANAYSDLEQALSAACTNDTIWIAGGTYFPENNPNISFEISKSLVMYGGFEGVETHLSERIGADSVLHGINRTLLSGNIGNPNSVADNSIHVVKIETPGIRPRLDGLTIAFGNAKGIPGQPTVNTPNAKGGGIYLTNASLIMDSCIIQNNTALREGGGLYVEHGIREGTLTLRNCTFIANSISGFSGGGGGGLRVTGNINIPFSECKLEDCSFEANSAHNGAGIKLFRSDAHIINSSFIRNNAISSMGDQKGGGAIIDQGEYEFRGCRFVENQANFGAGISASNTTPHIYRCDFFQNTTETESLDSINARGGGIQLLDGGVIMDSCLLVRNFAKDGGAINSNESGSFLITNCTFLENQAIVSGGAVRHSDASDVTYKNCVFEANKLTSVSASGAENGGGAINVNEVNLFVEDCRFQSNETNTLGGALFSSDKNLTLLRNTFTGNVSLENGGAVFREEDGDFVGEDNYFLYNHADSIGGGIALSRISGTVKLKRNTFDQNVAKWGGGMGNLAKDQFELTNCTFSGNIAQKGGGIYMQDEAAYHFYHCTVVGNTAWEGGGVWGTEADTLILHHTLLADNWDSLAAPSNLNGMVVHSQGHNLVGYADGGTMGFLSSDQVGTTALPIDPLLTPLANYGGLTPVHSLKYNSPARGRGAALGSQLVSDRDQRGYSRIVGSREDSIDIGAVEWQSTFYQGPQRALCSGDMRYLQMGEILLTDSTGGAFGIGDSLTLLFRLPDGLSFQSGQANMECVGEGLFGCEVLQVGGDSLVVRYSRSYTTEINSIQLNGIQVNVTQSLANDSVQLIRAGGTAVQYENQPEDSVKIANFYIAPTIILKDGAYIADFETETTEWNVGGINSSWEWGEPQGSIINTAASGVFAWVTNSGGEYPADENSAVTSPCFDFRNLVRPMISMDIWSDTEPNFDGAVLQASFDAGVNWTTVGTTDRGMEWYNATGILADPGNQVRGTTDTRLGWTGRDTTWRRAGYRLDELLADSSSVRFRIAFASVTEQNPDATNNGFAFDNIFIGERDKLALVEYFTDHQAGWEDSLRADIRTNIKDVSLLTYGMPGSPFYEVYSAGPRARALVYGISEPDHIALGGSIFLNKIELLRQMDFDRSTLNPVEFEITIDSSRNHPIAITSLSKPDSGVERIVYLAVVEDSVVVNGKITNGLLRKFLPDPGGISYREWPDDSVVKITMEPYQWLMGDFPSPQIVSQYENLRLLVFVQDADTKEIYQVASEKIWSEVVRREDVNRRGTAEELLSILRIFPNPTQGPLFVELPSLFESDVMMQVRDMAGRDLAGISLPAREKLHIIDLSHLAQGIYSLHMSRQGKMFFQTRISISK